MREHDEEIPRGFAADIKKAFIKATIVMLGANAAITGMCLFCTFPLYILLKEDNRGWIYFPCVLAVVALIAYLGLRTTLRHRKKLLAQLAELGTLGADALDREREETDFLYKTVYLLREYIYFPRNICLIPYCDIQNMETIYHSTNGMYDGAQLKFKLAGNKKLSIQMKKIRQFRDEHNWFVLQLEEKIKIAASTVTREDFTR